MDCSRRALLIGSGLMLLSGCGYQLRGYRENSQEVSYFPFRQVLITTQGTDNFIVERMTAALISMGCSIVTKPEEAEAEIWLGSTDQRVLTSAIGAYGEISARLYVMSQAFRVRRVGQNFWSIDTVIKRSREVDQSVSTIAGLGAERPLAISRESEEVVSDIRLRLVDGLIRQIQTLSPLDATL